MRMGQGVRTGLGHGGITCVLQTQFSSFKGLKEQIETAVVNELSVFEPLKFYCTMFEKQIKKIYLFFVRRAVCYRSFRLLTVRSTGIVNTFKYANLSKINLRIY